MIEDKIEEIIERKLRYCPEVREADIYRVHRIRVEELKGEISTLIQEERGNAYSSGFDDCKKLTDILVGIKKKEAVEGFVDWLDNVLMTQMRKPYIHGEQLKYAVETYLESEGK